jgi:hypothetical protein
MTGLVQRHRWNRSFTLYYAGRISWGAFYLGYRQRELLYILLHTLKIRCSTCSTCSFSTLARICVEQVQNSHLFHLLDRWVYFCVIRKEEERHSFQSLALGGWLAFALSRKVRLGVLPKCHRRAEPCHTVECPNRGRVYVSLDIAESNVLG